MRLVDVVILKKFVDAPENGERKYDVILKQSGILKDWMETRRFTVSEGNRMLAAAEMNAFDILSNCRKILGEALPGRIGEERLPELDWNRGEVLMRLPVEISLSGEETIEEAMKKFNSLLREEEIYARIKFPIN